MNFRYLTTIGAALLATALPGAAAADGPTKLEGPKQQYVIAASASNDERREGVDWQLNTGVTFNFNNNRSVVGQVDGSTLLFGFKLDGVVNYNHAAHEWRSTFALGEGLAWTPLVDELVKSRDALNVESIYLYHVVPWLGPFARLVLDTSLFRGADVRPGPTTYAIARRSGETESQVAARLALTDPLRPLMLKESLGAFVRPVAKDELSVEIRAGVGAQQTVAAGQLALVDDAATPAIEVNELDDVLQIGFEGSAQLWGALYEKRVLYGAAIEVMTPFAYSELPPDDDRSALELTNLALRGGLAFKLTEWAVVDYEIRALRQPQLLDKLQLQNNLLFTFGFSTGNLPPKK